MKKIILLAALFMASISYGQFTSPINLLKSKQLSDPPSCTGPAQLTNIVDFNTLTYNLLDTETKKYFEMIAKTTDVIPGGTVSTIDDILIYHSGSTDLVVTHAQTANTAFPTATGCGSTHSGAREFKMVLQYTPSYVAGTTISTVFKILGGDLITFTINVTGAVASTEDITKDDANVVVYPNPATDVLYYKAEDVKSVEVYNLLGQKVIAAKATGSVKVANLPSDVYVLKLKGDNGVTSTKMFTVK